jgi:hypothetical protein
MAVNFIDGANRNNPDKTTDLPQATDKLYHMMLYRVNLNWAGYEHNVCGDMHWLHRYV